MAVIVLMGLLGLGMVVGGLLNPTDLPWGARVMLAVIGAVLLLISFVITLITQLYQKASAEEAIVRTGHGWKQGHNRWWMLCMAVRSQTHPRVAQGYQTDVRARGA